MINVQQHSHFGTINTFVAFLFELCGHYSHSNKNWPEAHSPKLTGPPTPWTIRPNPLDVHTKEARAFCALNIAQAIFRHLTVHPERKQSMLARNPKSPLSRNLTSLAGYKTKKKQRQRLPLYSPSATTNLPLHAHKNPISSEPITELLDPGMEHSAP